MKSNLTGKRLRATLRVEGRRFVTRGGRAMIPGLCPGDRVVARAKGYEGAQVKLDEDGTLGLTLAADAVTTARQLTAWNASRNLNRLWLWVHPDAHAYISKTEFLRDIRQAIAAGYQWVDIQVKGLTYINWVFPPCSVTNYGGQLYPHTAAVRYTEFQTTPGGGVTPFSGVAHYVQTKDERWRWFPNAGCDYAVT